MKRIVSVVFLLSLLLTILPTNARAAETEVSRSQWLQALTQTFEMSVEEDNYPDNYFSDLSSDSKYYYDMLLAVEFGLVDIPAGGELRPDDPATREFAAQTLNFCLAFQRDSEEYTYSEYNDVTYPDDIQVAVDRGWFALENGAFLPQQPITSQEMDAMLGDANALLAGLEIDTEHSNTYEAANGVIQVPGWAYVSKTGDNEVTITDSPVEITQGDTFVVNYGGIPCGYVAESVTKNDGDLIITVSKADSAVFAELDVQGIVMPDLTEIAVAEGSEVIFVNNITGEEYTDAYEAQAVMAAAVAAGSTQSPIDIKQKIDWEVVSGVKITGEIKMTGMQLEYSYSLKNLSAYVGMVGNMDVTYSVEGDLADALESLLPKGEIRLIDVPFFKVCTFAVVLDTELSASIQGQFNNDFRVGVAASLTDGTRLVKSFQKKTFTMIAEAKGRLGLEAKLGIMDIPVFDGYVYIKGGAEGLISSTIHGDGIVPHKCDHFSAHLYAETGAKLAVDLFVKGAKWTFNPYYTIWNESNSPVRVMRHYEDGKEVPGCTIGGGPSYYTPVSSSYWASVSNTTNTSSYGYDRNGVQQQVWNYTVDEETGNATITGFTGKATHLVVPSTIDGYEVVGIGDNAFQNCSSLREISLPDGLVSIGKEAFRGCVNLRTLRMPDTVTSLGASAFRGCSMLSYAKLSENLPAIAGWTFFECKALTSITLPTMLETLGGQAFGRCTSLRSAIISPNIIKCETDYAFGVNTGGPFAECASLSDVTFTGEPTMVPANLFYGCIGLKEIVLPDTVTTIASGAFQGCTALSVVKLPDVLDQISTWAFFGCSSLEEIELPNRLYILNGQAFGRCTNLKKATIPADLWCGTTYAFGVNNGGPFAECSALTEIVFTEKHKAIPDYMFFGCTGLKEIELPDTVETIGVQAFDGCIALERVVLPEGITQIGNSAFNKCSSLKAVEVPATTTWMGTAVFKDCSSLESAKILNDDVVLRSEFFSGCAALSDVRLPKNITTLYGNTFYNCDALTELELPNRIITISDKCFEDCDALTSAVLPEGLASIGNRCFYECDALNEIRIPNTVTSMGTYCFYSCDLLKAATLSSGMATVPNSTFAECTSLEEIVIPKFTTSIETNAFHGCTNLKKAVIPREVTTISTNAFSYPDRMTIYGISGTYAETYANENDYTFVDNTESATSATLNVKQLTLNKGASETLVLTVTPETYTDAVTWKSSDTSIVTVSNRGVVKAIAVGTATIKVNVGSESASCKVTVVQPVTSISLNKTSLSMDALQTFALTATAKPDNAYNKTIAWSSSDETVATVDENGLVTALKKGSATITAAAQDGSGVTRKCTVTVNNSAHIVNRLSQFESPHNYPDNCTDFWVFTIAGEEKLQVTFDDRTNIEEDFDFLKIFDGNGNLIGEYTGTALAGMTVEVPGDTVCIQLISDEGGNEWGFKVTDLGVDIPNEAEGACGAEALWELNLDTGELMIFGSGAMENYTSAEDTPWYEFRDNIRTVTIGDRITAIGDHAFDGCGKLTTVFVPTSVTSIGDHAFANCGALKTVDYVGEKAAWDNIDAGTGNTALSNNVSHEAAKQRPVKEVEIDTSKKNLEITVNRCANTFEQIIVGIYDQNGKMVAALLISYDGLAETVTTELPQQYKNGYVIKTFCTDLSVIPAYEAQTHNE